jgi:phenylacetate-coenzyme A ligase PaaK-like adenylate-forming protein
VELEGYRPRVLIGRPAELQRLAEHVELGMLDLACVDHAIVVLTHYGAKPITDVLRVTLWQRFGVPIYELYLGPDNSLLASECAAHEGWHLEPGTQFGVLNDELILDSEGNFGLRTGLTGSLESTPCPCGRTSARLMDVEAISRIEPPRRLAASA